MYIYITETIQEHAIHFSNSRVIYALLCFGLEGLRVKQQEHWTFQFMSPVMGAVTVPLIAFSYNCKITSYNVFKMFGSILSV